MKPLVLANFPLRFHYCLHRKYEVLQNCFGILEAAISLASLHWRCYPFLPIRTATPEQYLWLGDTHFSLHHSTLLSNWSAV
jgi:hypothetical protein